MATTICCHLPGIACRHRLGRLLRISIRSPQSRRGPRGPSVRQGRGKVQQRQEGLPAHRWPAPGTSPLERGSGPSTWSATVRPQPARSTSRPRHPPSSVGAVGTGRAVIPSLLGCRSAQLPGRPALDAQRRRRSARWPGSTPRPAIVVQVQVDASRLDRAVPGLGLHRHKAIPASLAVWSRRCVAADGTWPRPARPDPGRISSTPAADSG